LKKTQKTFLLAITIQLFQYKKMSDTMPPSPPPIQSLSQEQQQSQQFLESTNFVRDVRIVMSQTHVSEEIATNALREHRGSVVESIMSLVCDRMSLLNRNHSTIMSPEDRERSYALALQDAEPLDFDECEYDNEYSGHESPRSVLAQPLLFLSQQQQQQQQQQSSSMTTAADTTTTSRSCIHKNRMNQRVIQD